MIALRDIPVGSFFLDKYQRFSYKDHETIGSDTNYCLVYDDLFSYGRGYSFDSNSKCCQLIDERSSQQLTLF